MSSSTGSDLDSDDSGVTQYKLITCTGQQPGSDIIVIGQELQFSSDESLIPIDMQEYVWTPEILRKLKSLPHSVPFQMSTTP